MKHDLPNEIKYATIFGRGRNCINIIDGSYIDQLYAHMYLLDA